MWGFHQKVSDVVSSNKVRVNYLAMRGRGGCRKLCALCCVVDAGKSRGKLRGLWYYFCTEMIG